MVALARISGSVAGLRLSVCTGRNGREKGLPHSDTRIRGPQMVLKG